MLYKSQIKNNNNDETITDILMVSTTQTLQTFNC